MKSKNRGITLIALVITIIILLILAGVTIGQLTGKGLFDKVKLAKEESEQAQKEENATLGDYENKINEIVGSRDNLDKSSYTINKIGEQIGTTPINVDISLYDTLYIKVIEPVYKENFIYYIPTFELNSGWYTIAGGGSDPGRFIRINVNADSSSSTIALNLHLAQVNGSDVTNTSKIIVYGIKY